MSSDPAWKAQYLELVQIVDAGMAEAMRRSKGHVHCAPGCSHCCFGPFAITEFDAWRLTQGLREIEVRDPDLAAHIRSRALEAAELIRTQGPPEPVDNEPIAALKNLPCPALDLERQACLMHEYRPVACRLHGPVVRVDGMSLLHCCLNYQQIPSRELEQMRVDIQTADLAAGLPQPGLTYIAMALSG